MFIARQPIFDAKLNVFGYELLFRQGDQSAGFDGVTSQGASASVLLGLYEIGLDQIVENKLAFINFDEQFIHSEALELISSDRMVVEMLEDVEVDELLLERLKRVKEKGYQIALDDFDEDLETYPLMPFADIIKFDLMATPLETICEAVLKARGLGKKLLAEKVETQEVYLEAKKMGFELFQGYFFSKPLIAAQSCNKAPTKLQYFRLISELHQKDPSYEKLAEQIQLDVLLSYRILRMVSARTGKNQLQSIKNALTFMGLDEIERWLSTMMLQDLATDKPHELIRLSIVRSRFAQDLSRLLEMPSSCQHHASLMGLFSSLDGILDQSLEEALSDMVIPEVIKDALIMKRGALFGVYNLMLYYEKGDWLEVERMVELLSIDEEYLNQAYQSAIHWASDVLLMIS
ncbi:EAL domain-containing protein [Eubacteriaceae bacterium ES3]|nr:EAL domain-containing protein [Eubacteriaceae bacterium ES3]